MKQFICTLFSLSICVCSAVFSQKEDSLLLRVQGLSFDGNQFFNIDGIEITKQTALTNLSKKKIYKKFENTSAKSSDFTFSDTLIPYKNYCVAKSYLTCEGLTSYQTEYYIQTLANQVIMVSFFSTNKRDVSFEREFLSLLIAWKIPTTPVSPSTVGNINFAGRKIPVGSMCKWRGPNNCQCPGNGQMDWSIHKTLEDANKRITERFIAINCQNNGKIIQDSTVNVIFEGTKTKARKLIFEITGYTSTLVGFTGGKSLTVYMVAATVRNFHVSCVMSFWNNDQINPSGLTTLLDQVMVLEN